MNIRAQGALIGFVLFNLVACNPRESQTPNQISNAEEAFDYLKELKGEWVVDGGDEGTFGWEFDVTSRGGVIVERLKVGTETEMATVYHLEEGMLIGNHFCQLQNQPRLAAVESDTEGDLHFLCNGRVGSTRSHNELHMHGVHFQKKDSSLLIWMDMLENEEVAFVTRYELIRVDE